MAADSSVRICTHAATWVLQILAACRTKPGRWLYRAGDRRAHRATNACASDRPVFTWLETRRIGHHAGNRQILRVDVWLVSAHRHPGKRCLLLRALRSGHLPCGSSPRQIAESWDQSARGKKFGGVTLALPIIQTFSGDESRGGRNDRWGAQLSQECPPPVDYQPIGTNNRTAQCRCLQCGRLFRLGLAIQVVPRHAKSFHRDGKISRDAAVPSSRGLQRAAPALGIDFRAAIAEDFGCILH